jgi:hypothetical protein
MIQSFGIAGAAIAGLANVVGSTALAEKMNLGVAGMLGSMIGTTGAAFGGGLIGAILSLIVAALVPKYKTRCAKCGIGNAVAADKSLFNGKAYPNRCPDCRHTW